MKKLILLTILCCQLIAINSQTEVRFVLDKEIPSLNDQQVGLRGSLAPLSWDQSKPMTKTDSGYTITLSFDHPNEVLEFKFVLFDNDASPNWESTPNRTIKLLAGVDTITKHIFDKEQVIDLSQIPLLTPEQLKEDIALFKTMVLDVHPGTYRYQTSESIAHHLAELDSICSQPISHTELFLALSKVAAAIQCDHTLVGPYNQSNLINSMIHYQKNKLPFTFKWIDSKMVILENASESDLMKRGTIIESIDGTPTSRILASMIPYIAADGATDGNRINKLEIEGYDFRYNFFDMYYPLIFPDEDQVIELEVSNSNGSSTKVSVNYITLDERFRILTDRYPEFPKNKDALWAFELLEDSIALLTINSFGAFGWKALSFDYKIYLSDVFKQIEESDIKHLIIDIRKNNGGADEMAVELFSYLVAKPKPLERIGRTRYITFPESLKSYVQTWSDNPWYYELKPDNSKPIDGYYDFKEKQKARRSDKTLYKGNAYLLTSGANTSLAYYTASRFRLENLGTIIGQETGGNLRGINGGTILFLRLPNSEIEVDFPIRGEFSLAEKPNGGVKPDVEVHYEQKNIAENRDLELEQALALIKN